MLTQAGRCLQRSDHKTFEAGDVLLQNCEVLGDAEGLV